MKEDEKTGRTPIAFYASDQDIHRNRDLSAEVLMVLNDNAAMDTFFNPVKVELRRLKTSITMETREDRLRAVISALKLIGLHIIKCEGAENAVCEQRCW